MKTEEAGRKGRNERSALWAMGLIVALGIAAPASAQAPLPRFGMVGLAQGQVASLSMVLVEPRDASHPGCRVTASFVDAKGIVLRNSAGRSFAKTVTLQPQIAAALEMPANQVLASTQARGAIRAVLSPAATAGAATACGCLIATVELRAANGVTMLFDEGKDPIFRGNPPPPPGGCAAVLF
jgi:hypothetical protein